jgi:hypothetical protein
VLETLPGRVVLDARLLLVGDSRNAREEERQRKRSAS